MVVVLTELVWPRYQELAELAMKWLQSQERPRDVSVTKETGRGSPVMEQMAHEVYRVVLFGVFYLQVSLLGCVPYIGESCVTVLFLHQLSPMCQSVSSR